MITFRSWLEQRESELLEAYSALPPDTPVEERQAIAELVDYIQCMLGGVERQHDDLEPPF